MGANLKVEVELENLFAYIVLSSDGHALWAKDHMEHYVQFLGISEGRYWHSYRFASTIDTCASLTTEGIHVATYTASTLFSISSHTNGFKVEPKESPFF